MGEKQAVLELMRGELGRWEALLDGMGEAQITAPLAGSHWSLKDVVAHLQAWQQRSVARTEAAAGGGEPAFPQWPEAFDPEIEGEPNDLNEWLYAASRDKPWPQVREEWRAGFRRLIALVEGLPEGELTDAARYPWLEGYSVAAILRASCEHHDEHFAAVREALGHGA